MITIDGSYGEGGGQLLRTAVALSALTGRSLRVTNIRAARRNPGLLPQHATACNVVAALVQAQTEGIWAGSTEITFRPGEPRGGEYRFDTGTAGSLTLVIQACLPVAVRAPAPVRLELVGGTDVRRSPPFDYLGHVVLPLVRRMGLAVQARPLRRGYYPRGGGSVELITQPAPRPHGLGELARDAAGTITGRIHTSRLPADIARRIHRAVRNTLERDGSLTAWPVTLEEVVEEDAAGTGGAAVLWAATGNTLLGGSATAERGKPSERVGAEAAHALLLELQSGATLDVHAADQLPVYLMQATEPSRYLVRQATPHLTTMAWLLPQFLGGRMELTPEGPLTRVECLPA